MLLEQISEFTFLITSFSVFIFAIVSSSIVFLVSIAWWAPALLTLDLGQLRGVYSQRNVKLWSVLAFWQKIIYKVSIRYLAWYGAQRGLKNQGQPLQIGAMLARPSHLEHTFVQLVKHLLSSVRQDFFSAIAGEGELDPFGALILWNQVHAVVILIHVLLEHDIPIEGLAWTQGVTFACSSWGFGK